MATKQKSTIERIVESISELVRQPLSDESNEVPSKKAVRRSKAVAAGPRGRKKTKTKARKAAAKKRAPSGKKKKSAKRTKKR